MTELKEGATVKLRADLQAFKPYGDIYISDEKFVENFKGKEVKITKEYKSESVANRIYYYIAEINDMLFTEEMFDLGE